MSRLAPLLTAWKRRYPTAGLAKTRGTGDVNDGTPVMVEMMVDGLWDNLSAAGLVMADSKVTITRGQSSEGGQSDPSRCGFTLKNHEEFGYPFSANNPLSPYWGKFGQGTRIRISVPSGFDKSYRFQGEITEANEDSDISGKHAVVPVAAAGILDRLNRNSQPLRSALFRDITRPDSAGVRTTPQAYWPMEDGSGAEFCAAAIGTDPMAFTGSPTLASFSGFDCSDAIPNMSGAKFAGYVPSYTINNLLNSASTVWFLLAADQAITSGTLLARIVTDTTRWELLYTTGFLNLRARNYEGTLINETGAIAYTLVGNPTWVGIKLEYMGAGVEGYMMVKEAGTENLQTLGNANDAFEATPVRYVQFNPLQVATDFYVGHCAVFFHRQDELNYDDTYTPSPFVLAAFNGERADVRFDRLCREEAITHEVQDPLTPHALPGVWTGAGQPMGPQPIGALLTLLRECEAADGGMIYEMVSDFGIGYRTLATLTSQSAAVTLSHGNHELSEQPRPRRDNSRFKNDVTVSRQGGASATVTDETSPLSIHPHPAGVGHYPASATLNVYSDSQLRDQAAWAVHLGTVAEPRYERIAVELAHPAFADGLLRRDVLAVQQGDRVDVTDTPPRVSYDDISQLALGFNETIDKFQHQIAWNTAPESPYRVAVIGLDGYDRIDAADSHLQVDADSTTSSLTVDSYDGTRWIDTANYSSKFPFDIRVGGERMTVTGITGITQDAFTRTESDSWGTADVGGAWSTQGGASTDFDVNGSAGTVLLNTVNVSRRTVLQTSTADIDQYVDISTSQLSTGERQAAALMARSSDTNNMYMARVAFGTSADIVLSLRKRVGGVETELDSFTTILTHVAGTAYRLRFRLIGSSLAAKVWTASAEEPTSWQVEATDTALDSARDVGTRSILFTGNTNVNPVISYDNYMGIAGQIFTVTRSVNGLVKPHTAGSDVHLFHPVYIGL